MSNPKDNVQAKANPEEGTILLSAKYYRLTFLGASCPCSASPGDDCKSLTIAPEKNKKGLIALAIQNGGGETKNTLLLSLSNGEKGPLIDLDNEYSQHHARLCQIRWSQYNYAELYTAIGDKKYAFTLDGNQVNLRPTVATDGNLICSYVNGDISEKQFLKQANQASKGKTWVDKSLRWFKRQQQELFDTLQWLINPNSLHN